jgi:hypothetical protein
MTTEQLNIILNNKGYHYKFINNNSTDKIIISIHGLGLNKLIKIITNQDEFVSNGRSVFDIFENPNLLEDPSRIDTHSHSDFYNIFTSYAAEHNADILFLHDSSWNHYLKGIPGIAKNREEIKDFINTLITSKGYKNVYFTGTFTSAWWASQQTLFVQSLENQVSSVKTLLFNPLNDISKVCHFENIIYDLEEQPSDLIKITDFQSSNNIDISKLNTLVKFVVYYSNLSDKNKIEAEVYDDLKNEKIDVELHPIETNGFNITSILKNTDQLSKILTDFVNM